MNMKINRRVALKHFLSFLLLSVMGFRIISKPFFGTSKRNDEKDEPNEPGYYEEWHYMRMVESSWP